MKKVIIGLVILIVLIIAYVAAGPFITIHGIKSGIESQDTEKLSECIDFPTLRSNLKEQLNAAMMKSAAIDLKDNPFGVLAAAFATKVVEGLVESFLTPSGMANLMEGKKPEQNQLDSDNKQGEQKWELFKNSRYTYDSLSKFSIWVKGDNSDEIRFVLTRSGVSWRLSNIVIPLSDMKSSKKNELTKEVTDKEQTALISQTEPITIDKQEFFGFNECRKSNQLSSRISKLVSTISPSSKEDGFWVYEIKSEVMTVPVTKILIGVCDANGTQDCARAAFLGIVIEKTLSETRNNLLAKTGIDFTQEKRGKEFQETLRPILQTGKNSNESILYCDAGNL